MPAGLSAAQRRALQLLVAQAQAGDVQQPGGLVVLTGLSYVGKTAVGRALAAAGASHLLYTTVKHTVGVPTDVVHQLVEAHVLPAWGASRLLVVDQVCYVPGWRRRLRQAAHKAGSRSLLVQLTADRSERLRRRAASRGQTAFEGRRFIGDEELAAQQTKYVAPSDEEQPLQLDTTDRAPGQIASAILAHVASFDVADVDTCCCCRHPVEEVGSRTCRQTAVPTVSRWTSAVRCCAARCVW